MKKFYLPPQLNGFLSHNNLKPPAKDETNFIHPDTAITADYTPDAIAPSQSAHDSSQTAADALDPDVEQALKEYYEYIGKQNNH